MCGGYWSQWDREDLDSWMGNDLMEEPIDIDVEEYIDEEEEEE